MKRPAFLTRLPPQYFAKLFGRVAAERARHGEDFVDLARGNPDIGPPDHVTARLAEAAAAGGEAVHGYPPFLGLLALKEAVAERYATLYGVELDPEREVAVAPGTKTPIVELALCVADPGSSILVADPGYPDYASGVAAAGARHVPLPLDPAAGWAPDFAAAPRRNVSAVYLNYPSNPCAVAAPPGVFAEAVRYAAETGAVVVHDFAYGDIVFDGRRPESFLASEGAREVGVELFSMSKSYGMAGWRLGFVVGDAELVARYNLVQDHIRAGIFRPLQEAAIAALRGPQDSVEARRATYERRRDRVFAALARTGAEGVVSEGTFYVWLRLPAGVTPESLLVERRVALAPGEGFGERGAGWARLSLAVDDDALDRGLERLQEALAAVPA